MRSVRRRCESTLRTVTIPDPFEVNEFAAVVSRRRGRRLELLPKQTSAGPCGVWVTLPDVDYVFYEPDTSALHRDHIVVHELGHLLRQHEPTECVDDGVLRELFPGLSADMVKRVLGRTSYSDVEEQEAEMIASLVSEQVHRREALKPSKSDSDFGLVERLQSTLGAQRRDLRG